MVKCEQAVEVTYHGANPMHSGQLLGDANCSWTGSNPSGFEATCTVQKSVSWADWLAGYVTLSVTAAVSDVKQPSLFTVSKVVGRVPLPAQRSVQLSVAVTSGRIITAAGGYTGPCRCAALVC
jgi:hypothetical protein